MKILAKNRRASFDYAIENKLIAGIILSGSEVKSAKAGQVQLKGSYVRVAENSATLLNSHISHYKFASKDNQHQPDQTRKLLLTKKQLAELVAARQNGKHIIPLAVGLDHGLVKVEIATATSKKQRDKRQTIKERQADREANRSISSR